MGLFLIRIIVCTYDFSATSTTAQINANDSTVFLPNPGANGISTPHPGARRLSVAQTYETMDIGSELVLPPPPANLAPGQGVTDDPGVTVIHDSPV